MSLRRRPEVMKRRRASTEGCLRRRSAPQPSRLTKTECFNNQASAGLDNLRYIFSEELSCRNGRHPETMKTRHVGAEFIRHVTIT